ncbi:MAG: carboxypeptidase-like regulatory domain-containing protein [Bacteroidia bacterium]|nr:carboxypeptidase-like regulatory domain-containing protein [Bacteroidia bacterium]
METFLYYLLRASVLMALFYGFYKLFFGKNTFHNFNRFSLISVVMLVAVLPIFRFNLIPEKKAEPVVIKEFPIDFSNIPIVEISELPAPRIEIPWIELLSVIFILGFLFALARYLIGLNQLIGIIRKSEKQTLADNTVLCVAEKDISPFSWMKYIVLSRKDISADNRAIINHERAHIHLQHSFDMIFFDLFTCVFWFNPFSWLLRREIQSVHEYQADEQVLNNGIDAKQYQLLLIRKSVGEHKFALANNFRQHDLHKRITMMMKNKTNKRMKWNYTAALPMLFLAMVALSVPKLNAKVVEKETEKIIETVSEKIMVSGQVVDKAGKAIPMVAVINKKDNSGTITDSNGNFVFNVERGTTVSFVMVGYKKQKVTFNKPETNFKVSLEKGEGENTELITVRIKGRDDINEKQKNQSKLTVSGFVRGKGDFISGVAVVIKDSSMGTVTDTQGKFLIKAGKGDVLRFLMAGYKTFEYKVKTAEKNLVIVLQPNDKEKFNTEVIELRTQDGKKPLYIVDGIRIPSEELPKINPDEIESISVLKNEASTSIYGEEGKNGVILVTTKKKGFVGATTRNNVFRLIGLEGKNPLILLDNKEISEEELAQIDQNTVSHTTFFKGREAVSRYGEKAKDGAVVLYSKNFSKRISDIIINTTGEKIETNGFNDINTAIIIDGKLADKAELEKMNSKDIRVINSDPIDNYPIIAEKYNIKGKERLIQVFTKK